MIFLHDSSSKSSFEESFEMKFYLEGIRLLRAGTKENLCFIVRNSVENCSYLRIIIWLDFRVIETNRETVWNKKNRVGVC